MLAIPAAATPKRGSVPDRPGSRDLGRGGLRSLHPGVAAREEETPKRRDAEEFAMTVMQFDPFSQLDRVLKGLVSDGGRDTRRMPVPMDVYRRGDE
jgi:hypothetical protein